MSWSDGRQSSPLRLKDGPALISHKAWLAFKCAILVSRIVFLMTSLLTKIKPSFWQDRTWAVNPLTLERSVFVHTWPILVCTCLQWLLSARSLMLSFAEWEPLINKLKAFRLSWAKWLILPVCWKLSRIKVWSLLMNWEEAQALMKDSAFPGHYASTFIQKLTLIVFLLPTFMKWSR